MAYYKHGRMYKNRVYRDRTADTGQNNDKTIVPPFDVIPLREFKSRHYPEIKQFTEGDLSEWLEMLHAVRVSLGQNEKGKTARPIRLGELVAITRFPHQGRDFRPDRKQEIANFGYYAGIHGKRQPYGPIWHKVQSFGERVIFVMFDYILPLSHRRFFACGADIFEIIGGKEVIRKIIPHRALRQIADSLDLVWHANNPKPEGLILDPALYPPAATEEQNVVDLKETATRY